MMTQSRSAKLMQEYLCNVEIFISWVIQSTVVAGGAMDHLFLITV